jgi:hypothetical protein
MKIHYTFITSVIFISLFFVSCQDVQNPPNPLSLSPQISQQQLIDEIQKDKNFMNGVTQIKFLQAMIQDKSLTFRKDVNKDSLLYLIQNAKTKNDITKNLMLLTNNPTIFATKMLEISDSFSKFSKTAFVINSGYTKQELQTMIVEALKKSFGNTQTIPYKQHYADCAGLCNQGYNISMNGCDNTLYFAVALAIPTLLTTGPFAPLAVSTAFLAATGSYFICIDLARDNLGLCTDTCGGGSYKNYK